MNMNFAAANYLLITFYFAVLHLQQTYESSSAFVSVRSGAISNIYRLGDIFANGGAGQSHAPNIYQRSTLMRLELGVGVLQS